jgi:hypothetical protein
LYLLSKASSDILVRCAFLVRRHFVMIAKIPSRCGLGDESRGSNWRPADRAIRALGCALEDRVG